MAFKLKFQGKGKNPYGTMVNRGLITPALRPGPGDEKKIKSKEELESEARLMAENAPKVRLKEGDEGFDPTKQASYVQKGLSKDQLEWLKNNPDYFKNNPGVKPKSASEVGEAKIFSYDDKPKETPKPPTPDYSYLDGATFGSGYQAGDFTTYGLKLMSKVGDDDPRPKSQQREGEDPMSRYLTQPELDYLKSKGRLKGEYRSGYDDYYKQFSPESRAFQRGVEKGLIDELGNTIQLKQPTESDNLFKESGLADN